MDGLHQPKLPFSPGRETRSLEMANLIKPILQTAIPKQPSVL